MPPVDDASLVSDLSSLALVSSVPGFHFYPPLTSRSAPTGAFRADLLPYLAVEIETVDSSGGHRRVARFTSSTGTAIQVRPSKELYALDIRAADYFWDPSANYRIRVEAGGVELGRADFPMNPVPFIARHSGAGPFMMGIAMRIEEGAADANGDGQIDWEEPAPLPRNGFNNPSISYDGRFIAFETTAALVRDDTNDQLDIYLVDREGISVRRVSVGSAGRQANGPSFDASVSDDGRFVSFQTSASNLDEDDTNGSDDVFVKDMETGELIRATSNDRFDLAMHWGAAHPMISADGRYVGWIGGWCTVRFDRVTRTREYPFIGDMCRNAVLARSGEVLAFEQGDFSSEIGVVDFSTTPPSGHSVIFFGNAYSFDIALSYDGRTVATDNLSGSVIVSDWNGNQTVVSSPPSGEQNGRSSLPSLSYDGTLVAFTTAATNLVAGPGQGGQLLRDLSTPLAVPSGLDCAPARLSGDGRFVVGSCGVMRTGLR